MSRSSVFEAMFSGRWDQPEPVVLEDTEPSAFNLFLQYLYGDMFTDSIPMAIQLFQLADKYNMKPLVQKCVELMSRDLQLKDALAIFVVARHYSLMDLMNQAGDLMASSFDQLVNDLSFRNTDEETLIYLLKQNDLPLLEYELFNIALRWAMNIMGNNPQQNQSCAEVMKNIVRYIRFPLMTAQEFAGNVVHTSILRKRDIINLFLYFNLDENARKDVARRISFSTVPREYGETVQFDFYQQKYLPGTYSCRHSLEYKEGHEVTTEICYASLHKIETGLPHKPQVAKLVSVLLQGLNYLSAYWPSLQAPPEPSQKILVSVEKETGLGNNNTICFAKDCLISRGTTAELKIVPPIELEHHKKYRIRVQFKGNVLVMRKSNGRSVDLREDQLTGFYLTRSSKSKIGELTIDMLHSSENQDGRGSAGKDQEILELHVVTGVKIREC